MVRLSTLDDDYYKYDEKHFRLVGKRQGRVFRLGDPVEVGILSADKIRNEINLYLIDRGKEPKGSRKKRSRKR